MPKISLKTVPKKSPKMFSIRPENAASDSISKGTIIKSAGKEIARPNKTPKTLLRRVLLLAKKETMLFGKFLKQPLKRKAKEFKIKEVSCGFLLAADADLYQISESKNISTKLANLTVPFVVIMNESEVLQERKP